jgi:hypothetical protein
MIRRIIGEGTGYGLALQGVSPWTINLWRFREIYP